MADAQAAKPAGSRLQGKDIVLTWAINAPVKKVWQAWKDPEMIKKWWGPKGFTAPEIQNDFTLGGQWLYAMHSPEGEDSWSTGQYMEINPMQEIITTFSLADKHGHPVSPGYYGLDNTISNEFLLTVKFEDNGDKTGLTLRLNGFQAGPDRDNAEAGWCESIDKLEKAVAAKTG